MQARQPKVCRGLVLWFVSEGAGRFSSEREALTPLQSLPHFLINGRTVWVRAHVCSLDIVATAARVSAGERGKPKFDLAAYRTKNATRAVWARWGTEALFSNGASVARESKRSRAYFRTAKP